jgi:RimJ/RimL family protein N-acetyltransferase
MTAFYTERLSHKLLEEQDVAFAASLYQDPKVMRKIGPVFTRERAEKAMINAVKANHHSPPNLRIWLISERETEKAVGIQMLKWAKDKNDEAEIGIMLLPKANGRQYAFEGMGALVDVGFEKFALAGIFAHFDTSNIPVARFVTNLGFTINHNSKQPHSYCSVKHNVWDRKVEALYIKQTT